MWSMLHRFVWDAAGRADAVVQEMVQLANTNGTS
jgi:hypothetical protein